jgi:hypothetical protein
MPGVLSKPKGHSMVLNGKALRRVVLVAVAIIVYALSRNLSLIICQVKKIAVGRCLTEDRKMP